VERVVTLSADRLRGELEALHADALRVGDSPLKADQAADHCGAIARRLADAEVGEEARARIAAALADAERVLRRDDDGREAAKHVQRALSQLAPRERKPSPFLDDE
jgi:hypothetical protein